MIIQKCDICKKRVTNLDTIILYKNKFDYCMDCRKKAEELKEKFKKEYEYVLLDERLKSGERRFIAEIDNITPSNFIIK